MEAANLPTFLQFGNAKKSDICVIFAKKIMGSHETGGGEMKKKLGGCAPSLPGPKTATDDIYDLLWSSGQCVRDLMSLMR